MSLDPNRLVRLQRALDVHARWQELDPRPDPKQLLAENEDIADLLEPLLEDEAAGEGDSDPADIGPGDELGGFVIERELGRGAMGIVFAARQRSLGRSVALKVLAPQARIEPRAIARFRRESALLAALDHPGLVDVITVGRDRDCEFFAMERVDGLALGDVVRRLRDRDPGTLAGSSIVEAFGESLPGAESRSDTETATSATFAGEYVLAAARIVQQVADALQHAHEAGVLHRDVKPSNILLRPDGRAVLTDFGLARRTASPSLTRTGDFAGTPYYVAPEQVMGSPEALDGRADVFSLGVTLYELISLTRPFQGTTNHEVVQSILGVDPPDPRRYNARIPADLAAITMRAIEKRPRDRYATARDLAADLEAFLERLPVSARPLSRLARARRLMQRHPIASVLTVVLAVGVPTVAALGGYLIAESRAIDVGRSELLRAEVEELVQDGLLQLEWGNRELARDLFARARELQPDNPAPLVFEVRALRRLGLSDEADALVEQGLGGEVIAPRIASLLGSLQLPEDDPPTDGEDATIQYWLEGWIRLERAHDAHRPEDFERARELLSRAALMDPSGSALILCQLAHALGHLSDRRASSRVADALEARANGQSELLYWAGYAVRTANLDRSAELMRRASAATESSRYHIEYNLGTWFARVGRVEEAIGQLRAATERDPNHIEAWANLGASLMQAEQHEAALAAIDRALELDPDRAMFHANRGGMLMQMGRRDESEEALRRALEIEPGQKQAASNLATRLWRDKRYDELIALHAEQAEKGHYEAWLAVYASRSLRQTGDPAGAARCLDEVIEREPHPFPLTERARYRMRSDRAAARADLERATQLSTPWGEAWNILSHLQFEAGEFDAAFESNATAMQISPGSLSYAMNRGVMLTRRERNDEALTHFMEVRERFPKERNPGISVAQELMKLGRTEEARGVLDELVEGFPADVYVHRNRLQAMAGELELMLAEHERWVAQSPDDPERLGLYADFLVQNQEERWYDASKARAVIERSLKDPPTPVGLLRLARIQTLTGEKAAGVETARRGLELCDDKTSERVRQLLEHFSK